jgi:exosortase
MTGPAAKSALAPAPSRAASREAAVWAAFAVLIAAAYYPTFRWMVGRWDEAESYMAHGWLIAPICAWLLWQDRARLAPALRNAMDAGPQARTPGAVPGFALFTAGLFLHLVAGLADVSSISGLTLPLVIAGFVLIRFGRAAARIAWFPIAFLAFMVPPPEFVISKMNFSLKLMAADFATSLLDLVGLPAIRVGSFMIFGSEKLAVGDVCSGLRSLLALLSLSVLYAWLLRDRGRKPVLAVLLMAVPAAVIGNGIRIFLVACLVMALGQQRVFKPLIGTWDLHLFTGAVIFAAAFGCLFLAGSLAARLGARPGRPAGTVPAPEAPAS